MATAGFASAHSFILNYLRFVFILWSIFVFLVTFHLITSLLRTWTHWYPEPKQKKQSSSQTLLKHFHKHVLLCNLIRKVELLNLWSADQYLSMAKTYEFGPGWDVCKHEIFKCASDSDGLHRFKQNKSFYFWMFIQF